jgi:NADH:ubiquinone oxidoreductase subunit F (NADH-binding)
MVRDQKLKAFTPSGPAGGFLPATLPVEILPARFVKEKLSPGTTHMDVLDLELDLRVFRTLGLMLGSELVFYGHGANMVEQALCCLRFFRNESCGKCVTCRIGTQKLVEIAKGLEQREYTAEAFNGIWGIVTELANAMELGSICGLGTVAANPLMSVIKFFPEDVKRYLRTD